MIRQLFEELQKQGEWINKNYADAAAQLSPLQGLDQAVVERSVRRYNNNIKQNKNNKSNPININIAIHHIDTDSNGSSHNQNPRQRRSRHQTTRAPAVNRKYGGPL